MSWRRLPLAALVLIGAGAICGALPGEMNGCDTDLTDEIDHVVYCQDRCEALCDLVVLCGQYRPPEGTPDDADISEVCQSECERHYFCVNPQLCGAGDYDPYPYISEQEAGECLSAWRAISCDDLNNGAPNCGVDFGQCPTIDACDGDKLCDPPEWE
jgi:hypothetical protein